jgi:hypothetical protein
MQTDHNTGCGIALGFRSEVVPIIAGEPPVQTGGDAPDPVTH